MYAYMYITRMYTEFFSGERKLFFFYITVLFLFSDVEHSCLPGSLDLRIKRKSSFRQFELHNYSADMLKLGGIPVHPPLYMYIPDY